LVNSQLIEAAMRLAETHVLRAYDAVQLATALTIASHSPRLTVTFVCADESLNSVARTVGLAIENPNQHG
jgi:predicted nucleic acid-binding protein